MNPWDEWEDWQAGFYATAYTPEHVDDSYELLADPERFHDVATEMLRAWLHAAEHNLIFLPSGHNAWIGQAACLYAHGAPAVATREAWGRMTDVQHLAANRVAFLARSQWRTDGDEAVLAL